MGLNLNYTPNRLVDITTLSELNLSSDKDGNYDLFPLFVVEKPEP